MRELCISSASSPPVAGDDLLVSMMKRGDTTAFDDLWLCHRRRLFYLALRILKNSEDAEDAIQESFLKAYRHIGTFDGRSKFSTWITRIVINTCLMALRRKGRLLETSINTPTPNEGTEWEFPDKTLDIESRYYKAECNQRLGAAVHCLPLPLRSVMEIYLERDTSLREIADVAGLSLPAVKSRLLRARRMLRASLANKL